MIIIAGTTATSNVLGYLPQFTPFIALFVAFIGALQLVFNFAGRARTHEILQRRYYFLMAEIEKKEKPKKSLCAKWEAEIPQIAADELPTMWALDAVADNQATATLIGSTKPRLIVSKWQYLTKNIFSHTGENFPENIDWK